MLFSSALERIFFRMPLKATMLVSLPMGKQVSPRGGRSVPSKGVVLL